MGNLINMISEFFGMPMRFFYGLTGNYAVTLFFFTIVVNIILLPLAVKQHKSQIKMAKIRPKEMVIRKKYAGRTDSATKQKMQLEVMEMYKRENYSQMAGCLPMLIQLPVIFALFNIVRQPLTFIARFSSGLTDRITEFLGDAITTNMGDVQIRIVRAFEGSLEGFEGNLDTIRTAMQAGGYLNNIEPAQVDLFMNYENMNFGFFGQSLLIPPSEALFSSLALIVLLNLAAGFFQMKVTKKLQGAAANEMMNNKSMKIMEYTMPLMITYFSFTMNSALGLYWIYRSGVTMAEKFVLSKVFPIPPVTDEDMRLAEEQYGNAGKPKKKKKKKPVDEAETEGIEGSKDIGDNDGIEEVEKTKKTGDKKQEKTDGKTAPRKFTVKRRNRGKK